MAKNVTTVLPEYPAHSGSSDHKAFGFFVCGERQAKETLYLLRPTTCYDRPDTISAKEWTERQAQHWRVRPVPTDEGDTEKEWQWFNATAEHAMREAMRGHGPPRDPPDRRPKGALISFVKADRRASECDPSSHKLCRLINLQGRLRECVRQSERGQPYFACLQNVRKSWPLWLGPVSDWTQLFELLTTVDAALLEVRQKEALAGIHKWQRQMAARGKKATQWLKGKSRPANFVVAEGDRVASVTASLKNLETFWRQIWERQCVDPEAARRKWAAWGNTSTLPENCCGFWSAPRLQQQARKKQHSTAGPGGWRGGEIATWQLRHGQLSTVL